MGTVSTPTFFTSPQKGFSVIYTPGTDEGYHQASAKDLTENTQISADIQPDHPNTKVYFYYEWEPGHRYQATVNFSYPVKGAAGYAPTNAIGVAAKRNGKPGANGAPPKRKAGRKK